MTPIFWQTVIAAQGASWRPGKYFPNIEYVAVLENADPSPMEKENNTEY